MPTVLYLLHCSPSETIHVAATLEGGSRKQTSSNDKVVDKLRRVRIVDIVHTCECPSMLQSYHTICISEKLENKSKSYGEAVQLAAGWGKSYACIEGNPSTNWCGCATQ